MPRSSSARSCPSRGSSRELQPRDGSRTVAPQSSELMAKLRRAASGNLGLPGGARDTGETVLTARAKAEIRRRMAEGSRALRGGADDGRGWAFCRRLVAVLASLGPERLVTYEPFASEVDPRPVQRAYAAAGVPIYVPRWRGGVTEFVRLDGGDRLVSDDQRVVILVPGMAFDRAGGRLGRGRGWYDRALAAHPDAIRVACCFDMQVVDEVPLDPWDVPMHHLVTEARSIVVGQPGQSAGERAYAGY